ncbi:bifunctional 23S rRNA (guanine(2069)-N(7))-methyltransferase RlmK/23S rRNA (guanine(2445)-N(2))-methyltransferase RlmL [Planctobacterium marinum]|uniref:Ribosomal RNA large subunit methyltransferase K/L n=1 Tax=Planctobacterium marinum TaxID=1631968 RepID=A0AA48HGB0_9ALTE|nr:ribosomal RNA large subunit methyltransferase K/L [Planctobacterium marinum]
MHKILITSALGLEDLLVTEIQGLLPHLECQKKPGQVLTAAELQDIYTLCLWSRLANRVLLQLTYGKIETGDDLYRLASEVDWSKHFGLRDTFAVDFYGSNKEIRNTQFGALKIKDAIVDKFLETQSVRPNVDKNNPDIRIQGRIHRDNAAIYLDMSGGSLHLRHYRQETGPAPIRENLAFAMLMRSGWTQNTEQPLCDPMCGSGTIAIEAALYKANIAPGLQRKRWGFSHWLKHNDAQWKVIQSTALKRQKSPSIGIYAGEISHKLISIAKQNAKAAGVDEFIQFTHKDATEYVPACDKPGYLVSNPPYGERLSDFNRLLPIFQQWGTWLKQHYANWHLALLTSNRELLKQMKLASSRSYKLKNANLDCELVLFHMVDRNLAELQHEAKLDGDFANRLKKNWDKTKRWLKKQNTECYRIYDADLPEYNVAIDRYGDGLVIQEYAAPKNIPEQKTKARLQEILLVAPQVLGIAPENVALKVREVKKGKNQYEKVSRQNKMLEVQENGAKFLVNLFDYLDTGLFLDHRDTRCIVRDMSKGKRVLNLFSYTGSVSVYAALGGAQSVTTVDMSNTYLDWAKQNFELNKLRGKYQFIKADVTTWLEQNREKYDLIFIDPPSFSNSKSMDNTWDVQRDHVTLLADAKNSLAENGVIVFSNNLRNFKMSSEVQDKLGLSVTNITAETIPEDFKRNSKIHHCFLLQVQ